MAIRPSRDDRLNHSAMGSPRRLRVILAGCLVVVGCVGEPVGKLPTPDQVPSGIAGELCGDVSSSSRLVDPCCSDPPFKEMKDCRDLVEPHLEASVQAAMAAGLTYSVECLFASVKGGCTDATSGSLLRCEDSCQVFFGDQPEGAACEAVGHRMSDCQPQLVCGADRTCHDPCELSFIAPEGGFCGPQRGMWFVTCDTGLACTADGTCQPAQPFGAPCDAMTLCAVGGWCDETGTCAAQLAGGSSCDADVQCSSGICRDDTCYEPESSACARSAW